MCCVSTTYTLRTPILLIPDAAGIELPLTTLVIVLAGAGNREAGTVPPAEGIRDTAAAPAVGAPYPNLDG